MRHWRPEDEFVRLRPADRRDWTKIDRTGPANASSGLEPAHVGLALVAAVSFGLGYAFYEAIGFADSFAGGDVVATIPYFGDCPTGGGRNCVVSGDTFDLGGEKIRIAGIEAPQVLAARCASEERAGKLAARQLRDILNSGAVTLRPVGGVRTPSAPALRIVLVDARDIGDQLVTEGYAVRYTTGARPWCRPTKAARSVANPG